MRKPSPAPRGDFKFPAYDLRLTAYGLPHQLFVALLIFISAYAVFFTTKYFSLHQEIQNQRVALAAAEQNLAQISAAESTPKNADEDVMKKIRANQTAPSKLLTALDRVAALAGLRLSSVETAGTSVRVRADALSASGFSLSSSANFLEAVKKIPEVADATLPTSTQEVFGNGAKSNLTLEITLKKN